VSGVGGVGVGRNRCLGQQQQQTTNLQDSQKKKKKKKKKKMLLKWIDAGRCMTKRKKKKAKFNSRYTR
jgi:hypothetical protein